MCNCHCDHILMTRCGSSLSRTKRLRNSTRCSKKLRPAAAKRPRRSTTRRSSRFPQPPAKHLAKKEKRTGETVLPTSTLLVCCERCLCHVATQNKVFDISGDAWRGCGFFERKEPGNHTHAPPVFGPYNCQDDCTPVYCTCARSCN